MLVVVYLRRGFLYVPTLGKIEDGPYRWVEPYSLVSIEEKAQLRQVLGDRFARGNPTLEPTPLVPSRFPVAGGAAYVDSWSTFERESRRWYLRENEKLYQIQGTQQQPTGHHQPDPAQLIHFPEGTDLDAVSDRLIEILETAHAAETLSSASEDEVVLDDSDRARIEALQAEIDAQPWAYLPPGDRPDELGNLLEWIANATPEDIADIEKEIRYYYYNRRDKRGGDALTRALHWALEATDLAERAAILKRFEPYTHAYTTWDQHLLIAIAEGWRSVRKRLRRG